MLIPILLISGAVIEFAIAAGFAYWLGRQSASHVNSSVDASGEAWIVLTLRGCDPTLPQTLQGLNLQSRPNTKVCIVIDSDEDPAKEIVRTFLADHQTGDRFHVRTLATPLNSCSLKCSAVAEAAEWIITNQPDAHFIALIDADVKPQPDLISELVAPLRQPGVGVVSGARWFEPPINANFGATMRSLFNAGALVPTIWFQNPWAGAMAMRCQTVVDGGLIEKWRASAVDDGPVAAAIKPLGLRSVVVPQLIQINRENCDVSFFGKWLTRTLTWSRMFEPTFWLTVFNAVASSVLVIACLTIIAVGLVNGDWLAVVAGGSAMLISATLLMLAHRLIRISVYRVVGERQGTMRPYRGSEMIRSVALILPTLVVFTASCLRAATTKTVHWRGVDYTIHGSRLQMQQYSPYRTTKDGSQEMSI